MPTESAIHNLCVHIPKERLPRPMRAHPHLLAPLSPICFCAQCAFRWVRSAETWTAAAPTTTTCLPIRGRVTPNAGRELTTRRLEGSVLSRACSAQLIAASDGPLISRQQAGYSSVGRASDCRVLQQSDGPWFDSGWPDLSHPCLSC